MKRFIYALILIVSTLLVNQTQSQAQRSELYVLANNDSINDIANASDTLYHDVETSGVWSLTASTGTITGSGGSFQIIGSNDGTTWFNYPNHYTIIYNASDSTVYNTTYGQLYTDTIASNNRYTYYDTFFPYRYVGVKTTKGTCNGKRKLVFYSNPKK